jgi:hypothetical protein
MAEYSLVHVENVFPSRDVTYKQNGSGRKAGREENGGILGFQPLFCKESFILKGFFILSVTVS